MDCTALLIALHLVVDQVLYVDVPVLQTASDQFLVHENHHASNIVDHILFFLPHFSGLPNDGVGRLLREAIVVVLHGHLRHGLI